MAQSLHDVSDLRNASILISVNGELKPLKLERAKFVTQIEALPEGTISAAVVAPSVVLM